jgi:hypothetical protein
MGFCPRHYLTKIVAAILALDAKKKRTMARAE